jgi:hypothetical protein
MPAAVLCNKFAAQNWTVSRLKVRYDIAGTTIGAGIVADLDLTSLALGRFA